MIDFQLSPEQQALRSNVSSFATAHLSGARALYEAAGTAEECSTRFRSTLPIYQAAVRAGLIKAQVPQPLGGMGGSLMDAALVVEEMYAVETSASLTILGTGLGLTPLLLAGSPEQHEKYLKPFLSGEGEPLASLVFSEPTGSANYASPGSSGLMTTAKLVDTEYVISGEKIWATNSSGWDDRGADLQCVICRIVSADEGNIDLHRSRNEVAIIIVTRDDIAANKPEAYTVLSHPPTHGHTAVNGPHIRFTDLRVPATNLLAAPGKGAEIVDQTFTASATLVGAMSVGVMRQIFEHALTWAKIEKRGGSEIMLQKQSVADLLIKIKTRCEASRMLTWKAAFALGYPATAKAGAEISYETKIFSSESAVESAMDAINLIGVSAYHRNSPLGHILNDALVLPIFDGGNIGVRRRQIEKIFGDPDYQPWEASFGVKEHPKNAVVTNGHHA